MNRRTFLKVAGSVPAALAGRPELFRAGGVLIDNQVPGRAPIDWAIGQLRAALQATGVRVETSTDAPHNLAVVVDRESPPTGGPESLRLERTTRDGVPALRVLAGGTPGYVYAALELAERVRFGAGTLLDFPSPVVDQPANRIRGVARAFCSEVEDKSWFYDQDFWRRYLDHLAACRFNQFSLYFGFGYDFPRDVTDDYFQFVYPFFLAVPGYSVRVVPLGDDERDRNLAALSHVGHECAARGLAFHIGIWTHPYEFPDSPRVAHRIAGLTPETHAAYCRDALALLLQTVPQISGVTFRTHGESGIPENSYGFWETIFDAFAHAGRPVTIDLHSKGINDVMIGLAVKTRQPVIVSPKFSSEHQALGYHQADIRELEIPTPERMESGVFAVSNGDRRFTRYGYADLLARPRAYDVLFRLWPGTQRHLLSGDPALAAAYGRAAQFGGAIGMEFCDPLTFKGRGGSGQPGGRCAYADASLEPRDDWQKFEHTYRLWGRLSYDPGTSSDIWRRALAADFGAATPAADAALANASRVLPLMTSAWLPSGSNRQLWYELPQNMPIVPGQSSPYTDTPEPKIFANVSPLDPQLFSTVTEHVGDLLAGRVSPKYSPAEVAQWIEDWTRTSEAAVARARAATDASRPAFRRLDEDVRIQIGLGRYYAGKIRAALLFAISESTHDAHAISLAQAQYAKARAAWAAMAERAKRVYRADIAYGDLPFRRGHWIDRLPSIDADLSAMRVRADAMTGPAPPASTASAAAIVAVTARVTRPAVACAHSGPSKFDPGAPLELSLTLPSGAKVASVTLRYRHVNHAERWQSAPMSRDGAVMRAAIPAAYTQSEFLLQYYFELRRDGAACFHPAFNATVSNQPYYVVAAT
jgi:hypothetical protein